MEGVAVTVSLSGDDDRVIDHHPGSRGKDRAVGGDVRFVKLAWLGITGRNPLEELVRAVAVEEASPRPRPIDRGERSGRSCRFVGLPPRERSIDYLES